MFNVFKDQCLAEWDIETDRRMTENEKEFCLIAAKTKTLLGPHSCVKFNFRNVKSGQCLNVFTLCV